MYIEGNPKTKKQVKQWLAGGRIVRVFSPGPFPVKQNGQEHVEGPHYPAMHTWYAAVQLVDGKVTSIK